MTKKTDAWMPLYVADYLADTSRLTTEQHGAYLLLLMDYWRNGPPPDDDTVMASITRLQSNQWRKARIALVGFFTVADGKWTQKRAEHERQAAIGITDKRSAAGKAGASKRWGCDDSKDDVKDDGKRIAKPSQSASQNDAPSPSPLPIASQLPPKPPASPSASLHRFPPGFEELWSEYPRKVGKDAAAKAFAKRRPDASLLSAMVVAVKAQRSSPQWAKDGGQFVPHLSTWLNEGRWLDESDSRPVDDVFGAAR